MALNFLGRIDAEIRKASDVQAACLRAERASYLARLGEFQEAADAIADIKAVNRRWPNAHVTAWLKFAEGIATQHRDMAAVASDGLKRAKALANAVSDRRLQSLSAAWLAYIDYTQVNLESLKINLAEAISNLAPENVASDARISLTMGLMLHIGEGYEAASEWYDRCRNKAAVDGDELMISAMMHNMAWVRVADHRFRALSTGQSEIVSVPTKLSAESTANFDALIGVKSLTSFVPLLRSQVHLLADEIDEALELLETYAITSVDDGLSRLQSSFISDQAYCYARIGRLKDAARGSQLAIEALNEAVQIDDRAATYSRLAQIFNLLGDANRSSKYSSMASCAWAEYGGLRRQIAEAVRGMPRIGFP